MFYWFNIQNVELFLKSQLCLACGFVECFWKVAYINSLQLGADSQRNSVTPVLQEFFYKIYTEKFPLRAERTAGLLL